MESQLPEYVTGTGTYNRYVNAKGSDVSARFHLERVKGADGEWAYHVPAWDIRYTDNGSDYTYVGCVTAFPKDGVQATIKGCDTVKGSDPFAVFEAAVKATPEDYDAILEDILHEEEEEAGVALEEGRMEAAFMARHSGLI